MRQSLRFSPVEFVHFHNYAEDAIVSIDPVSLERHVASVAHHYWIFTSFSQVSPHNFSVWEVFNTATVLLTGDTLHCAFLTVCEWVCVSKRFTANFVGAYEVVLLKSVFQVAIGLPEAIAPVATRALTFLCLPLFNTLSASNYVALTVDAFLGVPSDISANFTNKLLSNTRRATNCVKF